MPQLLDLDRVVAYLDERGFRKDRRHISLAGRGRALQEHFDEAWFYARLRKGAAKNGELSDELERDAVRLAARSWPLSLMLARHYARLRQAGRAEAMVSQFAALVAAETDAQRLAYYRGDVASMAPRIARMCGAAVAEQLRAVLADGFGIEPQQSSDEIPA